MSVEVGPVAVVGASLAGVFAARSLRSAGLTGDIVVFGAEPHDPYDRPPLSKQVLHGAWPSEKARLPKHEHDDGIDWRLGTRITALDAAALRLTPQDAEPQAFPGGIVVATGAVPRTLPGLSDPPPSGVHYLRGLDDAIALRRELEAGPAQVVVVGGGFIGAEVAAAARTLGLDVTMIEVEPVPFARALGETVGAALGDLHRRRGVRLRTGVGVASVDGADQVESVTLADGSVLPADVVVLGLGVVADTTWLQGSGLTLDDGVVCDPTLRAAPLVYAAGDAARWPDARGDLHRVEHWDNAVRQGRYLGPRLVAEHRGEDVKPFETVPWMWSDQYDTKVQVFGDTRGHDEVEVVERGPGDRMLALYRRGDDLAAVLAVNRTKQAMRLRPLLARGTSWTEARGHVIDAAEANA